MLCFGRVKPQRLKARDGQDIAVFIEMDDRGGDVFLSGRVSPRLPVSGARIRFRLSITKEQRWVAQNGEWLYASHPAMTCRRDGLRVDGVVSTVKPQSDCCWITIGDLDGGVYCLSKWCPRGVCPPLGARVSFQLKKGKLGDWRVSSPPGLVILSKDEKPLLGGAESPQRSTSPILNDRRSVLWDDAEFGRNDTNNNSSSFPGSSQLLPSAFDDVDDAFSPVGTPLSPRESYMSSDDGYQFAAALAANAGHHHQPKQTLSLPDGLSPLSSLDEEGKPFFGLQIADIPSPPASVIEVHSSWPLKQQEQQQQEQQRRQQQINAIELAESTSPETMRTLMMCGAFNDVEDDGLSPTSTPRKNAKQHGGRAGKILAAVTKAGVAAPTANGKRLCCRFCDISFSALDGVSLCRHFLSRHSSVVPPATSSSIKDAYDEWMASSPHHQQKLLRPTEFFFGKRSSSHRHIQPTSPLPRGQTI